MYLLLMRRDQSTAFNHNKHNITGAAKWPVCATWRYGELTDLRCLVGKDETAEHTVRSSGAIGASMTGAKSTNVH